LKHRSVLLVLILLTAFGLRVWGLADHNIWWDEGISVWAARLPVHDILEWTGQDVHPPLYYLLLKAWLFAAGEGEFALRFLSVVGGTLGVAAAYGLGKALGGTKAGLLTALFLTLSRFSISWSQEIRMYAWATTLATFALWSSVKLFDRGGWRPWAGYVLATTGGLLSIYLVASVPLIANIAFLVTWLRRKRPLRMLSHWLTAQLAVVALYVPWVAYAVPRMHSWSSSEPLSPAFFIQLYATTLAVGVQVDIDKYGWPTLAVFGTLAVVAFALIRSKRTSPQTAGLLMLALGLILPAIMVYVISLPGNPIYARPLVPRYLLPLSLCFYCLLGWGLAVLAPKRRWVALLGVGLVIGVAISGLADLYPGRARRDDYASLVGTLEAHRHAEDSIVLHTDKDWPLFSAQFDGPWIGIPYGRSMDETVAGWILEPVWEESSGIWLVTTPDSLRNDPQQAVQSWLGDRSLAVNTWELGENNLSFYARTAERANTIIDLSPQFEPPSALQIKLPSGAELLGAWVPLPRYLTGDTLHLSMYWSDPPSVSEVIELSGPSQIDIAYEPPLPAQNGPTHQQVDITLSPDLPSGRYHLSLREGNSPIESIGHFTLVRRRIADAATPSDIQHPMEVRLGEAILLLGYDLAEFSLSPSDSLELTLYWQATEPVQTRYKVFVHLVGEVYNPSTENLIWGQQDREPVNWQVPTTLWTPETVVVDSYVIPLSPDIPPGSYELQVGMYGLVDGIRLPAYDTTGISLGDAIILTPIEVELE
jgi:hypothetical protein